MGIRGLSKFIKDNVAHGFYLNQSLSKYQGKTIAVDFNQYLYKFMYMDTKFAVNIYSFIEDRFMKMTQQFLKYDIKLIYVMDGRPPKEKMEVIQKRQTRITKNKEEISRIDKKIKESSLIPTIYYTEDTKDIKDAKDNKDTIIVRSIPTDLQEEKLKAHRRTIKIRKDHCDFMEKVFEKYQISYIHLPNEEADIVCKYLVEYGFADYCLSDDLDMLAYGCTNLLCNYNFRDNIVDEYNYQEILADLKLDQNQFLDICISCGTDFNSRLTDTNVVYYLIINHLYQNIPDIIQNLEVINQSIRNKQLPFHFIKNAKFIQHLNESSIENDFYVKIADDFKLIPPTKLNYHDVITIFHKHIPYDYLKKHMQSSICF